MTREGAKMILTIIALRETCPRLNKHGNLENVGQWHCFPSKALPKDSVMSSG